MHVWEFLLTSTTDGRRVHEVLSMQVMIHTVINVGECMSAQIFVFER